MFKEGRIQEFKAFVNMTIQLHDDENIFENADVMNKLRSHPRYERLTFCKNYDITRMLRP